MSIDLRTGAVISSSIVILLEGSTKRDIGKQEAAQLMGEIPQVGLTEDGGLVLSSFRNQYEVVVRQSRIDVVDRSGKAPGSLALGKPVAGFVKLLDGTPKAIGFNFELEVPTDEQRTAGQQLAGFLTFSDVGEGRPIAGRVVAFAFSREGWQFTARIEPRWGDPNTSQLFVAVNVHRDLASVEEGKAVLDRADTELARQLASAYNECVEALLRLPA